MDHEILAIVTRSHRHRRARRHRFEGGGVRTRDGNFARFRLGDARSFFGDGGGKVEIISAVSEEIRVSPEQFLLFSFDLFFNCLLHTEHITQRIQGLQVELMSETGSSETAKQINLLQCHLLN